MYVLRHICIMRTPGCKERKWSLVIKQIKRSFTYFNLRLWSRAKQVIWVICKMSINILWARGQSFKSGNWKMENKKSKKKIMRFSLICILSTRSYVKVQLGVYYLYPSKFYNLDKYSSLDIVGRYHMFMQEIATS